MTDPGISDIDAGISLVIITGMSGAGRSTAANAMEDAGWFVVDNLPPELLPPLVELGRRSQGSVPRIAAVVDVRGRAFFDSLRGALERAGRARDRAADHVPGGL